MEPFNTPVSPALERLGPSIKLLHGAVSGLELILQTAEKLDHEGVKRALPFFGLIWLYGSAMRDLLRATRQDGSLLWNAPALAALCRPLQEAFLSLVYFAIETPQEEEAELRQLLLHRHIAYKRWDLLRRADQSNEDIAQEFAPALADWEMLNRLVQNHSFLKRLEPDVAKRITKNGDLYIFEPLDEVWSRTGLPHELYDLTFRYLSQYAHATPYAMASLRYHKADCEDGAVNMTVPIGLALGCVMKTLQYAGTLHAELSALLPPAFHEYMTVNR